jgi:hypothetical protein
VAVWKEDIVSWLVVRIRCEGSGIVESDAELRLTTLFNREWMLRRHRRVATGFACERGRPQEQA